MPDPRQPPPQDLPPGEGSGNLPPAPARRGRPRAPDLQVILDNLREAIFTIDSDGRVQSANAAATALFGIPAAEWPGTPVERLHLSEESARRFQQLRAQALQRDGLAEGEYLMRGCNGLPFPAETLVVSLAGEGGGRQGEILVVRDITHRKNNEEQVRSRTHQLMVLHEVGTLVNRSLDLDRILSTTLRRLRSILEVDVAAFYLATDSGPDTHLTFHQGSGFEASLVESVPATVGREEGSGPARRAAVSRQVVFIEDLQTAGEVDAPLLREAGVRSTAYVPIETQGQLVGVLALGRRRLEPFSGEDVDLFLPLGQLMATATSNATLVAGLRNLNEQLLALHELSTLLASSISERKAVRATLSALTGSLSCPVSLFLARRKGRSVLQAQESEGMPPPLREGILASASVRLEEETEDPLARAYRTSGLVEEVLPAGGGGWLAALRRQGLSSVIAAPILHQGDPLGVIALFAPGRRTLDENERRLLLVALRQAGASIANARLLADVRRHRKSLARLSSRILTAQEEERRHLSRELHDGIGQSLSALKLGLELMGGGKDRLAPQARADLERTLAVVSETIAELRHIAHDLRPSILDDLGLVPTLRWFTQRFQEQTGLPVRMRVRGTIEGLSPLQDVNLYRIVQEGLTNVVKHAQATSAEVRLKQGEGVVNLSILDDGIGINPAVVLSQSADAGLGLVGIRERVHLMGGRFRLRRRARGGSMVAVQVPISRKAAQSSHASPAAEAGP